MKAFRRTTPLALFACLFALLLLGAAVPADAQGPGRDYAVTITNVTPGQVFGPPLVVTHSRDVSLFTVGEPASPGLAIMAEDADLDELIAELEADPGVHDIAVADGPLMPGASVTLVVNARFPRHFVSAAQMLVQTNDAFFALSGMRVPQGPSNDPRSSVQSAYAVAYDAGSEANTESCDTVPGPPCGSAFVRDPDGAEGFVHVSNGIHGIGDLPPEIYDWRNPVARITIRKLR